VAVIEVIEETPTLFSSQPSLPPLSAQLATAGPVERNGLGVINCYNLLARSTTSATASKEGKVPVSSLEKT